MVGSSPLTRGKQRPGIRSRPVHGLIPAHAGKTARWPAPSAPPRAHPRSRGENWVRRNGDLTMTGSSPLTRGKRRLSLLHATVRGLIPAHAGKTASARALAAASRAHPRSRGENFGPSPKALRLPGSSPLTRGKLCRADQIANSGGLIPAHAGKTSSASSAREARRAHPRSRGENRQRVEGADATAGSSPLTRGKLGRPASSMSSIGLIPAHAGKTQQSHLSMASARAHPRSRGENPYAASNDQDPKGSSPLTRGKLLAAVFHERRPRLIPAHAGKTGDGR